MPFYKIVRQEYLPTNVDESEFELSIMAPEGTTLASMQEDSAGCVVHGIVRRRGNGFRLIGRGATFDGAQQAQCLSHMQLLLADHTVIPSSRTLR